MYNSVSQYHLFSAFKKYSIFLSFFFLPFKSILKSFLKSWLNFNHYRLTQWSLKAMSIIKSLVGMSSIYGGHLPKDLISYEFSWPQML